METINLPRPVRLTLYVLNSLTGILVTYLSAVHKIGPEAVTAFGGVTVLITALAGYNAQK